jgi:two-component system, cell cycle sensor histidine kinase and response regulator CckA
MTELRTARVPPALRDLFVQAEQVVSEYFKHRIDDPAKGTIEIAGERYVLVRAASLSVEFFDLVEKLYGSNRKEEARTFSQNILFDLAHALGKSDAQSFHEKMDLVDPASRLSAGPIHFSHSGWAFVDINPASKPQPNKDFFLLYDHPYSFESDAWLTRKRATSTPVCIMNAGYSSGWCEESFGLSLVASEILCRARGDACCRFIMAPPEEIEKQVANYVEQMPNTDQRHLNYEIPDFFARKAMEEELRAAQADLEARVAARTEELHLANQRLIRESQEREKMYERLLENQHLEALGRLAGGIAHDFNNLLGVIIGCGSMLERHLNKEAIEQQLLKQINEASQTAAHLTRQLVTFSQTESAEKHAHDVNHFLADLEPVLRRILGKNIELSLELNSSRAVVVANGNHLEQLIFNLAQNAQQAMPEGGSLQIRTEALCDDHNQLVAVKLVVSDTGTGMSPHTQARVFDPFFSTKTTRNASGLGLALVYSIVESIGGQVLTTSALGSGSSFCIKLPATR